MFGLFCVFTDTGDCWHSKSYTLIVLKLRFQKKPASIPHVREAKQADPSRPRDFFSVIFFEPIALQQQVCS